MSNQRTILYADDEQAISGLAVLCLEALGFACYTASNGAEAVRLFMKHRDEISAAVLDLSMPEMGGDEAARAIRAIDPGLPIILASGYSQAEIEERADPAVFSATLLKPFTLETLEQAISGALGVRR